MGTIVIPLMGDYFADTDPQPGWTWLHISLPPKTSDREGEVWVAAVGGGLQQSPTSPRPVPDQSPTQSPTQSPMEIYSILVFGA